MDATLDLLTVSLLRGISARAKRELLLRGPAAAVLRDPERHADLLPDDALRRVRSGQARDAALAEHERARALGILLVGRDDPAYPALLRAVYAPPPVLYVRGVLAEGDAHGSVAIVGSRAASAAGRVLAETLGRDLAAAGLTVVSGLARGIDTAAHEGAVAVGGRTVAVLGCGLDRVYPPENAALARRIAERGAVVSEFALGTPPDRHHFPQRNRVIAGWSRAVVVVEAAARSGALSTARAALDEGREVMAVPGHPSLPGAEGTNSLIRDGAALIRHAGDVAAELGFELAGDARGGGEDPVLAAFGRGQALGLDDLRARCGLETPALLARLTELELQDAVRRLPGALFVRHPH